MKTKKVKNEYKPCFCCVGDGKVNGKTCPCCYGSGWIDLLPDDIPLEVILYLEEIKKDKP